MSAEAALYARYFGGIKPGDDVIITRVIPGRGTFVWRGTAVSLFADEATGAGVHLRNQEVSTTLDVGTDRQGWVTTVTRSEEEAL